MRVIVMVFVVVLVLFASRTLQAEEQKVNPLVKSYLEALHKELKAQGYHDRIWVISGKRSRWFNNILVKFGNARKHSQHLDGNAIDIVVEDVNGDHRSDGKDVDIVYTILDSKIVGHKGGVGTYKTKRNYFYRQMVHFDCRGTRVRWNF